MDEAIVKVIFGIRGSGKTVKLRRVISDCSRIVTINTLNREGFNQGVIFNDLKELKEFWLTVYKHKFRIIFAPDHGDIEKICHEVDSICQMSLACGNMTLAIEEMNVLFEDMRTPSNFNKIIYAGREPGIELVGVAQRPIGFGSPMRSQTKEAFIFHVHEQSDLEKLQKLIGKDAAKILPTLENYHYLYWNMNEPQNYEIKKDEPLPYM